MWLLFLTICTATGFAQLYVADLKTESLTNPYGIDAAQPRFSWLLHSDKRNVMQSAYEIRVTVDKDIIWESGKVVSDQSVYIPFGGKPLQSDTKYNWQVKVWDNYGAASSWSKPAFFQTALLNKGDWKAKWISPDM